MNHRTAALLCTLLLLAACAPDNQPPPKIFKEQTDALAKAKALDAEMQKQNAERQKTIEQQTKE
jgi:hypothetical protein